MSYYPIIGSVMCVWTLLSLVASERAPRQAELKRQDAVRRKREAEQPIPVEPVAATVVNSSAPSKPTPATVNKAAPGKSAAAQPKR